LIKQDLLVFMGSMTQEYNAKSPMMYSELADWFHLITDPADYAEEAEFYRQALLAACVHQPETLLELGSGGGNNASHLKNYFQLTLVDLSPEMLNISSALNPECEHIQGDMRSVRLERLFDAVFIHDAVMYLTSEIDLRAAMETAYIHCKPGGAALFAPDDVLETFKPSTDHGGHDGQSRSMRYLEWTVDPDPSDTTYVVDYVYMLKNGTNEIRIERDRHIFGIFPRQTWLSLLTEIGFKPRAISFKHSELETGAYEVFVGYKNLE
jgi:ubiquinone/menaquinone biosynthesis C-methylase UbiE